jgi:hypothetical protein
MLLNHPTGSLELNTDLDCFQGRTQGLSSYKLLSLGENDLQVALKDLLNVCLFQIFTELVRLRHLRINLSLRLCSISIFNQQRGISNN